MPKSPSPNNGAPPPVVGTPAPKPPAPMPPVQQRKGAPISRASQRSSESSSSESSSDRVAAALRDSTNNRKGGKKRSGGDDDDDRNEAPYKRQHGMAVPPILDDSSNIKVSGSIHHTDQCKPATTLTTITPTTAAKTPQLHRTSTLHGDYVPPSASTLQALEETFDLFTDENNPKGLVRCQCVSLDSQCAFGCPTSTFLATYGWEYRSLTRQVEHQEFRRMQSDDIAASLKESQAMPITPGAAHGPDKTFTMKLRKSDASTKTWDLNNYLARQPDLTGAMRAILVDWIVELSDEYNLAPATLHLAITLIDKCLACSQSDGGFVIHRDLLQCLGCSCCWIASKIEEVSPPTIDDFVYISDNLYTSRQIQNMERDVCLALKFHLWHITPVHFAQEFLLASCAGERPNHRQSYQSIHSVLRHMVFYLVELSRLPYDLVSVKPSLVAAAAVFLARATLGFRDTQPRALESNGFWTNSLQYHSGYSVADLKETVLLLLSYQREAEESSLRCVYRKYSSKNLARVSLKTVLAVEDLGFGA